MPVEKAIESVLIESSGAVHGEVQLCCDGSCEFPVSIGIELIFHKEHETAGISDVFDVGFWHHTGHEKRNQFKRFANGKLRPEFGLVDIAEPVLDFSSICEAVLGEYAVQVVSGHGPGLAPPASHFNCGRQESDAWKPCVDHALALKPERFSKGLLRECLDELSNFGRSAFPISIATMKVEAEGYLWRKLL